MSWLLADMKKKMADAKATIEQSFKEAVENEDTVKEVAPKEPTSEKAAVSQPEKENVAAAEFPIGKASPQSPQEFATETAKRSMAALFGGLKVGGEVASSKIFEYAKDAGKKLEEVKNAVIENTMLGDLNKEQDEFEKHLQDEREKLKIIGLPWEGLPDEVLARKQMMSLSTDTRNFLRDSAANSEYSYEQQQAMATLLLKEDPSLANVRFQLVPKQVKESQFWQNYFYRIGLIRQSMLAQGATGRITPIQAAVLPVIEEKKTEEPSPTTTMEVNALKPEPLADNVEEKELNVDGTTSCEEEDGEDEELREPVIEQPAASGEQTLTSVDEEWEREILADLNGYDDVVEKTGGKDEEAWEAEIQELLNSE